MKGLSDKFVWNTIYTPTIYTNYLFKLQWLPTQISSNEEQRG